MLTKIYPTKNTRYTVCCMYTCTNMCTNVHVHTVYHYQPFLCFQKYRVKRLILKRIVNLVCVLPGRGTELDARGLIVRQRQVHPCILVFCARVKLKRTNCFNTLAWILLNMPLFWECFPLGPKQGFRQSTDWAAQGNDPRYLQQSMDCPLNLRVVQSKRHKVLIRWQSVDWLVQTTNLC